MRTGEHKIARSYVIYRADRTRMREQQSELQQPKETLINVTFENGQQARWTPLGFGPSLTKPAKVWKTSRPTRSTAKH